jgi:hypothetical protein
MHLDGPGWARASRGWLIGACVVLGCGLGPAACTLLVGDDAEQCSTTAECVNLGAAFAGTVCSGGRCVPQALLGGEGGSAGGAAVACTRNTECLSSGGGALCRQNACVQLTDLAAGCELSYGTVIDDDDNNTLIGLLAPLSTQGVQSLVGNSLLNAFVMARENYAAAVPRLAPLAPIVIRCDESLDPVRSVGHLVDTLGVKMIVGPVLAENFPAVVGLTRPKGVVLVSPTVDDPALADVGQAEGLVWGCRTNREQVARYYPNAIAKALEIFRARQTDFGAAHALVVVNRNDPTTSNFLDRVNAQLKTVIDGSMRSIEYDWSSAQNTDFNAFGRRLVDEMVTGQSPPPNVIIFPTSIDSVEKAILGIDTAWPLGIRRPTFVVDEAFNGLDGLVTFDPGVDSRLLGVRTYRGAVSRQAYTDYASAYRRAHGSLPIEKSEYGFDCFYESLYALSAASSRVDGNVRLGVGGEPFRRGAALIEVAGGVTVPVGQASVPTFFQTLIAGAMSIDLVGSSGALNFGAKNYPVSAGELYCISVAGNFCGTGTVFDAVTGAPQPDPEPDTTCVCAGQ